MNPSKKFCRVTFNTEVTIFFFEKEPSESACSDSEDAADLDLGLDLEEDLGALAAQTGSTAGIAAGELMQFSIVSWGLCVLRRTRIRRTYWCSTM